MLVLFVRSFVKLVTLAIVVGTTFYINGITAPVERGDFDECFNPHTAQVFVADDARCTENPYATDQ